MTAGGTGLGFDVVNSGSHSLAPVWRIDYVSLGTQKVMCSWCLCAFASVCDGGFSSLATATTWISPLIIFNVIAVLAPTHFVVQIHAVFMIVL